MMISPHQDVSENNHLPSEEEEDYEETDEFVTASNGGTSRPFFDLSMINGAPSSRQPRGSTASVATTAELASSVGSVMMMPKEAFMKSFTIQDSDEEGSAEDINWGITFGRPIALKGGLASFRNKNRLPVANIEDESIFALSRIRQGDYLKSINGKAVGPSYTGERALSKMKEAIKKDGYLTVITKNREEGTDDVLLHATIVKPRPDMTLEELGMTVWVWGYLCIKNIKRDTIFRQTALKDTDNIISVNEIICENVSPEQFANIVKTLPREITITVLRRKQRSSGNFK